MAKIFGTLTLVVLAIAIFVGLKNKAHYQTEIDNRKEAEKNLEVTQKRLEKATNDLAATTKDHDDVKAEIPRQEAQKSTQEKANEELAATKAAKNTEVEANKTKLSALNEKTASLGNVKDLASKMGTMINDLKTADDTVVTSEAKLATLTSESNRVDAQVGKQREEAANRSKGESFATLKTRISAIYPNWGFVTLAAGNAAGVITNSTLDVVREDETVAKLLVTAVEASTASASIIPESVKADTVLMVGDRVVPGAKMPVPQKPASSAPVAAPSR